MAAFAVISLVVEEDEIEGDIDAAVGAEEACPSPTEVDVGCGSYHISFGFCTPVAFSRMKVSRKSVSRQRSMSILSSSMASSSSTHRLETMLETFHIDSSITLVRFSSWA